MDVDAPNSFSRLDSFDEQWGLLRFNENSDQISESYDTFSSMDSLLGKEIYFFY